VYGGLTASPLPPPRTFGSRLRRFGRCRQGEYTPNPPVFSRCASRAFLPDAGHCPTPRRRPSRHATTGASSSRPFRPSARDRVPTRPSADSCLPLSEALASRSPTGQQAGLPGAVFTPAVPQRRIYTTRPQAVEDFVAPCPLVPSVARLVSGSCPSPRPFAPRCLQTPPRGDALALPFSFGLPSLERGLPPPSVKTCPAHTTKLTGREPRSGLRSGAAGG